MTARYRCCWCGSFSSSNAKDTRKHVLDSHRRALITALGVIEYYGTQKPPVTPLRRLKDHPRTNLGVSGEGDS